MNKIEVVNDKIINGEICDNCLLINEDVKLYIKDSALKLDIKVDGNIKIFELITNSNCSVNYSFSNNSMLEINRFLFDSSVDSNINLDGDNSEIICNHSIININDNTYNLNINHSKNTKSKIVNHGINLGNSLTFKINGIISALSKNVISNQDSSIITFKDNVSRIEPNFIIRNNDVIANHSSYVGEFKKNILFYLKARGLSETECYRILSKAFLIGHMNLTYDEINDILEIINNYWR